MHKCDKTTEREKNLSIINSQIYCPRSFECCRSRKCSCPLVFELNVDEQARSRYSAGKNFINLYPPVSFVLVLCRLCSVLLAVYEAAFTLCIFGFQVPL